VAAAEGKRRLRNYLLDARFQLKFTLYIVAIALVIASVLGSFLWTTSKRLLDEAEVAVQSRQQAAETSKELSNATLSNKLMEHLDDPAFEARLREESAAIDARYEAEKNAIMAQREQLVRQQRSVWMALVGCLVGFVLFIAAATIITTHRIVGPLYRIKRLVTEVSAGHLKVPQYPLRDGDELKDVFDAMTEMVQRLRDRQTEDAQAVSTMIERASRSKAAMELVPELQALETQLRARLSA
jgi:flagellar basal body-associated protein FliL